MTALQLISRLGAQGIKLWLDEEGNLRFKAPKGALTAELKEALIAAKPAVIAILQEARQSSNDAQIVPLPREGKEQRFALSFAQQRLWFLDRLDPGNPTFHITAALRITGKLDIDVLRKVVEALVARHESLRTTFSYSNNEVSQVIQEPYEWLLAENYDLSGLDADKQKARIQDIVQDETLRSFDLTEGTGSPYRRVRLLRTRLARLTAEDAEQPEHILFITIHHIIADGWSISIFVRELSALYDAYSQGLPSPLPELPIQYPDFAQWQRNWMSGDVKAKQLAYWREKLAGIEVLELPTDFPRPPIFSNKGSNIAFELDDQLSRDLHGLSRKLGKTLFSVTLTAFQLLLARYSGQQDICVGTPVASRTHSEIEHLIGCFINTLSIRTFIDGNPQFTDLLEQVSENIMGAFSNQNLPFESIVEELETNRDMSYTPIFQTMYSLQSSAMDHKLELRGLKIQREQIQSETSKYDLQLHLIEDGDRLIGEVEYSTDLFKRDTIERFVDHFKILLTAITENPEQNINSISILTAPERQQIIYDWNKTEVDHGLHDKCVHQLFESQCLLSPDAIAISCGKDGITYQNLNRRANQWAHHLRAMGIGKGDRVGICLQPSINYPLAILAVLKAGAAYIPLDSSYPEDRIEHMLSNAQARVVLGESGLADKINDKAVTTLMMDQPSAELEQQPGDNPECVNSPDDLLYVVYTSGSTGTPKGATVFHRNEVNLLSWYTSEYAISEQDRVLIISAMGFDLTQKNIFATLIRGARMIFPSSESYDNLVISDTIKREQITLMNCAPSAFYPLIENSKDFSELNSLRLVLFGGESIKVENLLSWTDHENCRATIVNMYGPTECTDIAASHRLGDPRQYLGKVIPIGRPNANVKLYVLDDYLQPVPVGVIGELYIGGAGVGGGYLFNEELSAEKFLTNPFAEGRVYQTGDLVRYRPDGLLEFVSRKDGQIKIRGFRIELGEIEVQLAMHPGIKQCVVSTLTTAAGSTVLSAYYVSEDATTLSHNELRNRLKQTLPDYMVPVVYTRIDEVPLTPNGKVNRKALPEPELSQQRSSEYVAPRNDTELQLAMIWSEVLGIERIGTRDNFFELGGHSLLATQLVARIRESLFVDIPLRTLFDEATIESLSRYIEEGEMLERAEASPELIVVDRSLDVPMSFAQERLWIIEQFTPGSTAYNIPAALHLSGPLNIEALGKAIDAVVSRHEALRTTFSNNADGHGIQIIHARMDIPLEIEDCSNAADARQQIVEQAIAENEAHLFDLQEGPLFRARLIILGSNDHLLLLNMHHIISDAWSVKVLQTEIDDLYQHFDQGKPSHLPELALHYADYSHWQRRWLQGAVLERHLKFWVDTLAGAPALLQLPTDRPRPTTQTFNGAIYEFDIDEALVAKLRAVAQQQETTPYTVFLSGFSYLLSVYSGQEDICIGTPVGGRNRFEIENLIGYFINTVVIRCDLSGNPSVSQLLERIKDSSLGAFAHQDIPIERVLDALNLSRNISYPPVAQVGFSYISDTIGNLIDQLGEASIEHLSGREVIAKYDMTMILIESGTKGIKGNLEYNTDLFDRDSIARMMEHYLRLLDLLTLNQDKPLNSLTLLSEAELYDAVGVSREDYEAVLPLTPNQRDLYLNAQLQPSTLSNNLAYTFYLPFAVDMDLWREANQYIADQQSLMRTDILHTRLPYGDIAYQCVARKRQVEVELIDASDQQLDDRQVRQKLDEIIYRPFSYGRNTISTYHMLRVRPDYHIGIWRASHTITDGIAHVAHAQLVAAIYNELSQGKTIKELPPIEDRWHEHVSGSRAAFDSQDSQDYWRQQLANCEALDFTGVPQAHTNPDDITHSAALPDGGQQVNRVAHLEPALWADIKKYCRRNRITPAIYFKSLYGLLLKIYCRAESDFNIIEFSAGRTKETATDLGCYYQQLPFVFTNKVLNGESTVNELFNYVKECQRESRDKQQLSLMVQNRFAPQGRLSFMFNYYHFFPKASLVDGHECYGEDNPPFVENSVQLVIKEKEKTVQIDLYYQDNRFNDLDMVERIESLTEQLLSGVTRLKDLSYVSKPEFQTQTLEWNDTRVDLPPQNSVQQLIEQQAERTPQNIAVICDEGQLTYQQLNERANQLAHYLHQLGVGANTRVGLCLPRGTDLMVAMLAVIKSGGAYVQMDASYPQERLAYMLADSHSPVLLSHSSLKGQLPYYKGTLICVDDPNDEHGRQLSSQSSENPANNTDLDDLLYVIYTSGSTGQPKGAAVMHRGEINLLQWYTREFDIDAQSRVMVISALGFDLTQKNLLAPLTKGAAVVLPQLEHYDSDLIAGLIHEHQVSLMNCAPSAFYQVAEDTRELGQLSGLRYLILGGEPIRLERLKRWIERDDFSCTIVNNYGPTECTDIATFYRIDDPLTHLNEAIPAGKPNDNVQLYILNDDNQLLPTGLAGELCIAGEGVGRGYLNHDELNLQKFIPNPFGTGQMYRTGDLMRYRKDGNLEFIGRKDFQVKLNGLRIELGEVEYALQQLAEVSDSLVTVVNDRLVAYVICEQDPDQSAWCSELRRHIPVYMVPSQFVVLRAWPLTPNGKIDRKALPNPLDEVTREYVAPRNDYEEKLCSILCNVLGLERVSVLDDFFEIGGHSLAASRAIVQMREQFELDIPLDVLFTTTTVEKLASYIEVSRWAIENNHQAGKSSDEGPRDEGFL